MMLWCELHNTAGVKGGITNYDPSEYDHDISWLQSITQVRCLPPTRAMATRGASRDGAERAGGPGLPLLGG